MPFPPTLQARRERLSGLYDRLRRTHFGIDPEIRSLLAAFDPWYQFAEGQEHPRAIGLWGMTGTGKSSLVQALVKETGLEQRTFWLDAGECHNRYWLDDFFERVEEDLDEQPFIIVVDEFQHARTVDLMGRPTSEPSALRRFWEMLDTGRVIVWPEAWNRPQALERFQQRLEKDLATGAVIQQGKLVSKPKSPHATNDFNDDLDDHPDFLPVQLRDTRWAIPPRYWDDMREAHIGVKPSLEEFLTKLGQLDGQALLMWVEELLEARKQCRVVNAGKALIILLGNLDEPYATDKKLLTELHPDVLLHRHHNIGSAGIQSALLELFRIEQVGRMGTSHIIFPPIGQATIDRLVQREVGKHLGKLSARCRRTVLIDATLLEHLSRTSAIAALGARPVVQAVLHTVPYLLTQALRATGPGTTGTIRLAVEAGKPVAWIDIARNVTEEVELSWPSGQMEADRSTRVQRERVAAHEAGHLVCGVLLAGKTPLQVCARTRTQTVRGFVVWGKPSHDKDLLRSDVVPELATLLGGWAAERILYGAEGISEGSTSDLDQTTSRALFWAKKTAFSGSLGQAAEHVTANETGFRGSLEEAEEQSGQWIQAAEELALATLQKHGALFDECRHLLMEQGSLHLKELERLFAPSPLKATSRHMP